VSFLFFGFNHLGESDHSNLEFGKEVSKVWLIIVSTRNRIWILSNNSSNEELINYLSSITWFMKCHFSNKILSL